MLQILKYFITGIIKVGSSCFYARAYFILEDVVISSDFAWTPLITFEEFMNSNDQKRCLASVASMNMMLGDGLSPTEIILLTLTN